MDSEYLPKLTEELDEATHWVANFLTQWFQNLPKETSLKSASSAPKPAILDQQGIGLKAALQEFEETIVPNSLGITYPIYVGLVNSSPLPAAALADSLVSALDNNAGASHHGPAANWCEEEVIRLFCSWFGWENPATGMIVPGGSYANLHALLLARAYSLRKPNAELLKLVVYHSQAAHFSVMRSAHVIGIDPQNIRTIPAPGRGFLDSDAFAHMVENDLENGLIPCCLVANFGTTGTGAIDDLDALSKICQKQDIWFHVDACYGGAAMLLPEFQHYVESFGNVDSISIDPHKWFFMPLVSSIVLTRHPELEKESFALEVSYIPQGHPEPYQRGISTSRRATGITLWMAFRCYGWGMIAEIVRNNIVLARELENKLHAADFEILADGQLSIVCARLKQDMPSLFYEEVAEQIRELGEAWFATVQHDGKIWWRFNILNIWVTDKHIEKIGNLLKKTVHQKIKSF